MRNKISLFLDLIRFRKPVGTLLLAIPCWFGVILAGKNSANFSLFILLKMLFLFTVGAFLMRSAGCVINDIFDRKIDAKVERTKLRPLASGKLDMWSALVLLFVLLSLSLLVLLCFNKYVIGAGFLALALATFYPLMKRIIFYPQLFLGIAFNCGILMADLAINEKLFVSTMLMFAACVIWTLIYDTIYAFQDIEDDIKIGVKSSAIKFSARPQVTLFLLTLAMFALIFIMGNSQNFSARFYFFWALAFLYELFLVLRCNYSSPSLCLKAFKANAVVGIFILLAIIFG
jgi:4-hydroxybenzoate polyprenyltransferase